MDDNNLNQDPAPADDEPMTNTAVNRETDVLGNPTALDSCELTVVMPVYNEEDSLMGCARSWISVLDELAIDYRLLVINDGSTDSSADVLATLAEHPRVVGITKFNQGHGPTILAGYHVGAQTSEWVFQVDSDDEIPASAFPAVWQARKGVDAVFGIRTGRHQSADRKVISRVAALTLVRMQFKWHLGCMHRLPYSINPCRACAN